MEILCVRIEPLPIERHGCREGNVYKLSRYENRLVWKIVNGYQGSNNLPKIEYAVKDLISVKDGSGLYFPFDEAQYIKALEEL